MNLELFVPELVLAGTAIAVILLDLLTERKGALAAISVCGLIVSAGFAVFMPASAGGAFYGMLATDGFALFFKLFFPAVAILMVLSSVDYASKLSRFQGEYYALILLSTLGMMLMASATELITAYIAIELSSISLYSLVGFLKDNKSSESALKNMLLGAIASAVLLYGMALIFGLTGETKLSAIAGAIQTMPLAEIVASPALALGIIMMIAGLGFKIAAVPFHMWVPDVYEGAPTPITSFLSIGSKAAALAVTLRIFYSAFSMPGWLSGNWGIIFAVLAAIGMTVGNITAIPQTNIKRMMGYSSIAQAGYLMVGLATMGVASPADISGQSGIMFFLACYAMANAGAFAGIIAITGKTNKR